MTPFRIQCIFARIHRALIWRSRLRLMRNFWPEYASAWPIPVCSAAISAVRGRVSRFWHAHCILPPVGDQARLTVLVAGQPFAPQREKLMLTEPTLLVVDDEDAICEGCRRIFSRQGFDVRKCNDASEGLNLATSGDYTAILLDIKMPEMDGLHFLEALRKEKPGVPVVLMTGYPSIPNATSADPAGGFRLRDQTVYARRNLAGRASLCCTSTGNAATEPATPAVRRPGDRTRLSTSIATPGIRPATGASCGSARWLVRPGARTNRIRPPAADRRSGLSGTAAGGRDDRRSAATDVPAPVSGVVVGVNDCARHRSGRAVARSLRQGLDRLHLADPARRGDGKVPAAPRRSC